jgi:hypothetical protein
MPDGTISLFNREQFIRSKDSIGAGTVRTPFVDLFIGKHRISLQGGRPSSGSPRDTLRAELPDSNLFPLYLVDFRYASQNATGASQDVTITILDPNWDYLESLVASNVEARESLSFNFGWRGIHDRIGTQPIRFVLKNFTISYLPFQGAKVALQGVDAGVSLSYARSTGAFTATDRIDDVIKRVIELANPNLEVEIDSIDQKVGKHNIMENRTVSEYVNHLLKIAKGASGSNFIIRTEAGSSPEKTKIVIRADIAQKTVIRTYTIGRERMGTMFEFNPSAVGSVILSLGGGKASGASVDPLTKKVTKVTSTHLEDQPKTAEKTVNAVPIADVGFSELPFSELADVQGFVRGSREAIDSHQFSATAVVLGDPGLTPQQQISVRVLKSNVPGSDTEAITDRSLVHTSGIYRIDEAEHIISAGMFRTNLNLYRESGYFGAGELGQRLKAVFSSAVSDVDSATTKVVDLISDFF